MICLFQMDFMKFFDVLAKHGFDTVLKSPLAAFPLDQRGKISCSLDSHAGFSHDMTDSHEILIWRVDMLLLHCIQPGAGPLT